MIINILKVLFSTGIVYCLIKSKALEFSNILSIIKNPTPLFACSLILIFSTILCAFRWRLLIVDKSMDETISKRSSIQLTWIGLFFNTVLPGAITGDLVKYFYVKKAKPKISKSRLLSSVLLDRIIGLTGLSILASTFAIFNYTELVTNSDILKQLFLAYFGLTLLALIGFTALLLTQKHKNYALSLTIKVPFIHQRLHNFSEQIFEKASNKKNILLCLLISVASHAANVFAFWILTSPFYEKEVPLKHLFAFIPMGLLTTALPVAPAGMGVGHAAFSYLFKLLGMSNGASLFNLFFFAIILNNMIGVFPYLLMKKTKEIDPIKADELTKSLL